MPEQLWRLKLSWDAIARFWEETRAEKFIDLYGVHQNAQGTFSVTRSHVHRAPDQSPEGIRTRAEKAKKRTIAEYQERLNSGKVTRTKKNLQVIMDMEYLAAISYLDEATEYFGYYDNGPESRNIRVLRSLPDKFTTLSVDLQMEILDHLPTYEADL